MCSAQCGSSDWHRTSVWILEVIHHEQNLDRKLRKKRDNAKELARDPTVSTKLRSVDIKEGGSLTLDDHSLQQATAAQLDQIVKCLQLLKKVCSAKITESSEIDNADIADSMKDLLKKELVHWVWAISKHRSDSECYQILSPLPVTKQDGW